MKHTEPTIVLLPGMDGTGELFAPLLGVIPPGVRVRVVAYPVDRALSYDALAGVVRDALADEAAVVLVAESFSGPVALRYAGAEPGRVRGVVLCASFVRPPAPRWLAWLVWPVLFRVRPPAAVVRRLMVGRDAPLWARLGGWSAGSTYIVRLGGTSSREPVVNLRVDKGPFF